MVWPTRRAGAGQDRVSTVLIPRAISVAQGWCSVMAYIDSPLAGSDTLPDGHSRGMATTGPAPGLTSVMTRAATAALMMWLVAVVLAGDPVQALHVDGVWDVDGRLKFGAAGNAAGHDLTSG